MLWLRP